MEQPVLLHLLKKKKTTPKPNNKCKNHPKATKRKDFYSEEAFLT